MAHTKQKMNYCFTINNPTVDHIEELKKMIIEGIANYTVFQLEEGENKTKHFQGYIELTKKMSIVGLKKHLTKAHIEERRGSQEQARKYCMKPERLSGPWELGKMKEQGKRNDISQVQLDIENGMDEKTLSREHFNEWKKYGKAFKEYRLLQSNFDRPNVEVAVWIGPPGVGKTYSATSYAEFKEFKKSDIFTMTSEHGWMTGYNGEKVIIMNEFNGQIGLDIINQLCEKGKMSMKVHGTMIPIEATLILFTSNSRISTWWHKGDVMSFVSRITHYCTGPYDERKSTRKTEGINIELI